MKPKTALRFVDFSPRVLGLEQRKHWRVLDLVSIDGVDPCDLDAADRELAREHFGNIETIPPQARSLVIWRLGRGSGKSTKAASLAVFKALTADLSTCGPGSEPTVVLIAPRLKTARITLRMARELLRHHPATDRLVCADDDTKDSFAIRRPDDGRRVRIATFPASKAGAAARGFPIPAIIFDEAEFLSGEGEYVVLDKDIYTALTPRLLPGGIALFISTPWPTKTLARELFEKNWGAPTTALAAIGTTSAMNDNDPAVVERVEKLRAIDPETAAREHDCIDIGAGALGFFDEAAVDAAVDDDLIQPELDVEMLLALDDHGVRNRRSLLEAGEYAAAGMDLGLARDSAALAIAARRSKLYRIASLTELRPTKAQSLKLSEVIANFAATLRAFQLRSVAADAYAREPAREWSGKHHIAIVDAPAGNAAKTESYASLRSLFREGRIRIPRNARLLSQLKQIVATPMEGGGLRIQSPRRLGLAHGDLVAAVVIACFLAPTHAGLGFDVTHRPARTYRMGNQRGY